MTETIIQEAAASLAHDLVTDGASYNATIPQLYITSMTLIFIIHVIFFLQLKQKKTKRHVCVSYDQIVRRKQFHKLIFWAILSHPPPDDITPMATDPVSNDGQGGSLLPMLAPGAVHLRSWNNIRIRNEVQSFWRFVSSKIQNCIIRPLIYGPLAGLPLLTYIAHIIWQCRALEELYDYSGNNIMNNFNVSAFIHRDLTVRDSIQKTDFSASFESNDTHSKMDGKLYGFEYYRVLVALTFLSYVTDFFITYLSLSFIKSQQQQQQEDQLLLQYPHQQSNFTPTQNNVVEFLAHRGLCTLTPLCTALLVLYMHHFPSTPISVLPFIDTSYVFGLSSDLPFVVSITILTILSYRIYPLMSIFYGCTSGLLWNLGWTQFLADGYWGGCCIILLCFACAMSLKVELTSFDERNHSTTGNICRGLLLWIDYVYWGPSSGRNTT